MGYREFFSSHQLVFSGFQKPFDEAKYIVLGVPFDSTSTFRTGSRFAPTAIREASLNIETYSFRSSLDIEDIKIHDLGDLHTSGNIDETLYRLELVVRELLEDGKTPVLVGGEHTITLGALRGVGSGVETAVLSFDAHLDLRDKYMGMKTSHTTFMRRVREELKPTIIEVGTRAVCKEELNYAKKSNITFITSSDILRNGVKETIKRITEATSSCEKIYLTIDMDVLDPAFAPAVQNPEPEGLSTHLLLEILHGVCDGRVVALDLVEVTPHYDQGVTAIQAAKIIFETLCYIDRAQS